MVAQRLPQHCVTLTCPPVTSLPLSRAVHGLCVCSTATFEERQEEGEALAGVCAPLDQICSPVTLTVLGVDVNTAVLTRLVWSLYGRTARRRLDSTNTLPTVLLLPLRSATKAFSGSSCEAKLTSMVFFSSSTWHAKLCTLPAVDRTSSVAFTRFSGVPVGVVGKPWTSCGRAFMYTPSTAVVHLFMSTVNFTSLRPEPRLSFNIKNLTA